MASSGKGKRTAAKKTTGTTKRPSGKPATSAAKRKAVTAPNRPASKKSTSKKPETKPAGGAWAHVFTPREPGERRYWLVKSEPSTFSFDDLRAAKDQTSQWDGVRNFVARNFMRDGMKVGDQVFFYHSSVNPQAIVGVCEVVREAYPDSTAFDRTHHGYDEGSDPNDPTWYMVDLRAVAPLARPVTLPQIKAKPELAQMVLLRIGRLSVTPVTPSEWSVINEMAR
jgi:predicted RNA-binding protein with PUA-like domain